MKYLIVCIAEISMSTRLTKRIKLEVNKEDNLLEQMIGEARKGRTGDIKPTIEVTGNRLRIKVVNPAIQPEAALESTLNELWDYVLRIWRLDMQTKKVLTRVKDISVRVIEDSH